VDRAEFERHDVGREAARIERADPDAAALADIDLGRIGQPDEGPRLRQRDGRRVVGKLEAAEELPQRSARRLLVFHGSADAHELLGRAGSLGRARAERCGQRRHQ
jgi:hypothetical protein